MKTTRLKQRIETAASAQEVDSLLREGATFKQASVKTARQWQKAAMKRKLTLTK